MLEGGREVDGIELYNSKKRTMLIMMQKMGMRAIYRDVLAA